jgi:hypothetical protein
MSNFARFACHLLVAAALCGCGSPYYTADPIEAWVVDAETGAPIEGAVVTANWQLLAGSFDTGGRKLRQLEVMETVTDKNGRFHFPGFIRLNISLDDLGEEDPQVLVFKPGYQYYRATNDYPIGSASPGPHRASSANGRRLKMRRVDSDLQTRARDLTSLGINLTSIEDSGDLGRIPGILRAIGCERMRLKAMNARLSIAIPGREPMEKDCATR